MLLRPRTMPGRTYRLFTRSICSLHTASWVTEEHWKEIRETTRPFPTPPPTRFKPEFISNYPRSPFFLSESRSRTGGSSPTFLTASLPLLSTGWKSEPRPPFHFKRRFWNRKSVKICNERAAKKDGKDIIFDLEQGLHFIAFDLVQK